MARLLLLAPSSGFGGGIERVAAAVERCWPGPCSRLDLYRSDRVPEAKGAPLTKAAFAARAIGIGLRSRPHVVLALHVGLLPVAHGVASATRARTALHGHGREVWGEFTPAVRWMVARCGRLLASSEFTASVLARRAEIPRARVAVVPLPVDEDILSEAARAPRAAMRGPAFITVSRIAAEHRYKGHWDVLDCLPHLLERRPDASWIVVGDGDDVPALRARSAELGVAAAVRFEGRVSDERLVELYSRSTALVLPSVANADARPPTGEGFGLVYGEAAAFGLPSIASTASGGAADLVRNGETGLTVEPGRPQALAAAMASLLEDAALRDRLGSTARRRVLTHHSAAAFTAALLNALS